MKIRHLLLLSAAALCASAGPFVLQPIQPCPGCTGPVFAINNSGQIAGAAFDASGSRPFFGSPGSFTIFDVPGSTGFAEAVSITDTGIVSGDLSRPNGGLQVFTRTPDGTVTLVPLIPGYGAMNGGNLNNTGLMTGNYATDLSGPTGAWGYLLQGSTLTAPVTYPGAFITQLGSSNDAGVVVGYYLLSLATAPKSFIRYPDGTLQDFAVPGAVGTSLYDINNKGDMVGGYLDSNGTSHGFIYRDNQFTTIDYTGPNTTVWGLNDLDQVAGASYPNGGFFTGPYAGFIGSPVPEPGSLVLTAIGLFGCAGILRRAQMGRRS